MKSIQKSIRMTPEIYDFISSFHGNNFNDKFNNCLNNAIDRNALLRQNKIRLEKEVYDLKNQIEDYRAILDSLERISTFVNFACDHVIQK